MSERGDAIRRIYRTNPNSPFDDLWKWARDGKTKRERFRRFKALQRWAQGHRDNTSGDVREKWNARRKAYAQQKRKIARRMVSGNADNPALGTGAWGGSESIAEATVLQVFIRHGIPRTSFKRWETFGNPSSDHWMGNLTAYAIDGGIASAQWLHTEIAAQFRSAGIPLDATPYDYASRYCTAAGKRFRYQGIAATHGTGPHYHGGVRVA